MTEITKLMSVADIVKACPHGLHSSHGFSTGRSNWIHRGRGPGMAGRGTVAHHESFPDSSRPNRLRAPLSLEAR